MASKDPLHYCGVRMGLIAFALLPLWPEAWVWGIVPQAHWVTGVEAAAGSAGLLPPSRHVNSLVICRSLRWGGNDRGGGQTIQHFSISQIIHSAVCPSVPLTAGPLQCYRVFYNPLLNIVSCSALEVTGLLIVS